MNCHPVLTTAIRHVRRAIRRRVIRHAHHAAAAVVVAAGCIGPPAVVLMLPQPVAPQFAPADAPQPIPEPGGVVVFAVGVVGLVVWRRRLP